MRTGLDDLAAFAAVAEARSFTQAAVVLGSSTSNLSHTIRRLETRLGARLLERNSRSVAPTEAGARLLATLVPALESVDGALDRLGETRDQVAGTLRLTMTRQAYEAVIRPVLAGFTARHPAVVVEVMIDYAYRDIVAERFDAGIRLGEKLEQDMIALRVGPDLSMAVVATPDYLADAPPLDHPGDLTHHRCINYRMTGSGALYAWEFERDGRALDVKVDGPLAFNEPELMLAAALDGMGVAYLLNHEVERHVADGRLVRRLGNWTPPFPDFHLYHPSRRQMRPAPKALVDTLRAQRDASRPSMSLMRP